MYFTEAKTFAQKQCCNIWVCTSFFRQKYDVKYTACATIESSCGTMSPAQTIQFQKCGSKIHKKKIR